MADGATLKLWLSDEEFRLGRLFDRHELVVQANLSEAELRRCQRFYGRGVDGLRRVGYSPADIIKKYPALTLAVLVGHAGLAYDQGRYWEDFWTELGVPADPVFENALRTHLGNLLRRFRLTEFPDLSRNYIRLMAMHAGVPVHCVGDLVRVVEQHLLDGRERSAGGLVTWLTAPGKEHRLTELDVPVRNFITHGGEFALDVLDRILEFADHVVDHPDTWDDYELATETTGLPTILLDALIEELRTHPIGSDRTRVGEPRRRKPRLRCAVDTGELRLELPYPLDGATEPWQLSFDGDIRQVWPEPGWGVDDDRHPPTVVGVDAPVREIVVEHRAGGIATVVPVVDKADPLLLFTVDGQRLTGTAALPHEVVALYPSDATLHDSVGGEPVTPVLTPTEPVGWRGWRIGRFDLADRQSLQLIRDGRRPGVLRGVRITAAAALELPEPVAGIRTVRGLPVHAARPTVVLPAHPAEWRVLVRPAGTASWWIDETWTAETEETELDPFDGQPPGLLGLFEIAVVGPSGPGLRQTVFLAEGLQLRFDRPFRWPVAGGLLPVTATVAIPAPLRVDTGSMDFAATDRALALQVAGRDQQFRLLVDPPAIEVRLTEHRRPAQWRTSAPVVPPAALEAHAVFAIRVPGQVRVRFAVMVADRVLHTVDPDQAEGVFQASTRAFVDCVRAVGDCRIVANITAFDGASVRVTLATVRAEQLCRSIALDGAELVFTGLADRDDLAVHLWLVTAPWAGARTVEITGPRVPLPADVVDAGPLLAQVFVDDPWVSVAAPTEPGPSAVRLAQPGWFAGPDGDREQLSRFLAGDGPAPADAIPEVWAALLRTPDATGQVPDGLVQLLHRDPRSALETLGDSATSVDELAAAVIRTGLAERSFAADFTLNELHHNPWVGCMVEMADLPSLYRRRDQVAAERADTLAYLADKGGDLLLEVLRVGKARELHQGIFDAQVVALDRLPHAQIDALVSQLRLVPGAYLDLDTRVIANLEAFGRRADWVRTGWSGDFAAATAGALGDIRGADRRCYDVIRARNEVLAGVDPGEYPWTLLSVQSATLAMSARLRAHGIIRHPPLPAELTEPWNCMAEVAPRLVLTDLLIAEAFVTHVQHGDLTGADR
ncbi:hypothetical protein [Skermania piniformis]|uniref:Uncharacterized protein n=1 Tax=Skermania pinensis TaxID=39122 RepID=A0ABX8SAZ6_9ACTN|nr:hypothetical protein [Skermania piniformis]QXQ15029.1 hypothetical protein KV203_06650 [Skermania piniformis]